jgi:hypothetical protein
MAQGSSSAAISSAARDSGERERSKPVGIGESGTLSQRGFWQGLAGYRERTLGETRTLRHGATGTESRGNANADSGQPTDYPQRFQALTL